MSSSAHIPKRSLDPLGLCLLLFTGLNLNGIGAKFIGGESLFSPIALVLTLILLIKYARIERVRYIYFFALATICVYLFAGSIPPLTRGEIKVEYLSLYTTSIILMSAVYFWIVSKDEGGRLQILYAFKWILITACVFIILSEFLRPYEVVHELSAAYSSQLEDGRDRASGSFENPNEAAAVALYCLVLVVALPSKYGLGKLFQCGVAFVALVMTFSKAAMLGAIILTAAFLLTKRSLRAKISVLLTFLTGVIILWFAYEQDLFHFSIEQRERLADVLNLAGGEITDRTTTMRNVLLQYGVEKIREVFPWGAGLGELHAMEGSIRKVSSGGIETTRWLGVHNTFLTILGEGGVIPFMMLLILLCCLMIAGRRSQYRDIIWGFTIVFMIELSAGHHILMLRYADTVLAIAIALAVSSRQGFVRNLSLSGQVC
ncbi:O-antigen ligase [Microvirga sp. VF16]|uniref:O-antigen ligase family protein n=1 Tax=Microvirga sp. VF16 TaxID=2807101 RepID=UPI00193E102B|nr:O-antigen ligase family protein [Microvirga sp. VF16]QRM27260.1 O-antigen ligase family protein [Microvirga sp. VF16]